MVGDGESAAAFELIGQPDRLSILEVLIDARRAGGNDSVRFTDLRDGSRIDDTGRFNYHLEKLVGTFVTKTDDGYRLSAYGRRLMAPMLGGAADGNRMPAPIETVGTCHECGSDLQIQTKETVFQLVCTGGHVINRGLLGYPAVLSDRLPAETSEALGLLYRQGVERAVSGICPTCHGPVDGSFTEIEDDHVHRNDLPWYAFEAPCETCSNQFAASVGACVLNRPVVGSFLADHGVDVRQVVPWSLSFVAPGSETIEALDPLRLSVEITADDASLTVTVDRSATVVATDRETPA